VKHLAVEFSPATIILLKPITNGTRIYNFPLCNDAMIHDFFLQVDDCIVDTLSSSLLTQVLWWAKYFNLAGCNMLGGGLPCHYLWLNQLLLEVSRVARKEGNLLLSQKLLIDYLKSEDGLLCVGTNTKLLLEEVAQSLVNMAVKGEEPLVPISMVWSAQNAKALTEVAKILYG